MAYNQHYYETEMISDASGGYFAAGATLADRGVTSGLGLCRLCLPTTTPHVLIFADSQPYCAVVCFQIPCLILFLMGP